MILKTSSNHFKVAKHSFVSAILSNIPLSVVQLIALMLLIPVANSVSLILDSNPMRDRQIIYLLARTETLLFSYILIILFALIASFMNFSFLLNKRSVNVYFSLGITRKTQFMTRYFAGLIMLLLPILLTMITSLIMNFSNFPYSSEAVSACLYYIFGFGTIAFVCYTITTLVTCLVGTLIEGISFSALILLLPTTFFCGLNFVMKYFLFGNGFGAQGGSEVNDIQWLIPFLKSYNPLLFFLQPSISYGAFSHLQLQYPEFPNMPQFPIHPWSVLAWLLIGIALTYGAAKSFQKRKAEIAETVGANKVLNFICTFSLSFLFFGTLLNVNDFWLDMPATLFIATGAFILIYALCDFILLRRLTPLMKGFIKLPVHLAICVLILGILATGGFGYSNRVPAVENIKSAYITYKGSPDYLYSSCGGWNDLSYVISVRDLIFTDKKDIERVTQIHRDIIHAGKKLLSNDPIPVDPSHYYVKSYIRIEYTLQNGSQMIRFYDRTTLEVLAEMLTLDDTIAVKKMIGENLDKKSDPWRDSFQTGKILISNNYFSNTFELPEDEVFRNELLSFIKKDVLKQTVAQRYYPETQAVGIIRFTNDDDARSYDLDSKFIYITKDFSNTLKFLKDKGLFTHFDFKDEVESISISVYPLNMDEDGHNQGYTKYFRAAVIDHLFKSKTTITDPAQITELLSKARTNYFAKNGGYILKIKLKGKDDFVYKFLPAADAPEYVKDLILK